MGIESDQLVFDYLSRVGDLAQQRQLPSADRMRLVSEVRRQIESRRAGSDDNPAAVRRLLARIGSPEELVSAAGGGEAAGPGPGDGPGVPRPRAEEGAGGAAISGTVMGGTVMGGSEPERRGPAGSGRSRPGGTGGSTGIGGITGPGGITGIGGPPGSGGLSGLGGLGSRSGLGGLGGLGGLAGLGRALTGRQEREPQQKPRGDGADASARAGEQGADTQDAARPRLLPKTLRRRTPDPEAPAKPADAPSPPHLASTEEIGRGGVDADWWRSDDGPTGLGQQVPGFVGGIEIPEILKPPPQRADLTKPLPSDTEKTATDGDRDGADKDDGDADEGAAPRRPLLTGLSNPLLVLAALSLVAGAVLGGQPGLIALGAGWLVIYLSRRLSRAEVKWAVLVVPALSLVGGGVWLWGRSTGRWGEAIGEAQMSGAIADTWPWVLRAAAVGSALFVFWRSQRVR